MSIVFCSNSEVDIKGGVIEANTARYRSAYVPKGFTCSGGWSIANTIDVDHPAVVGSVTWIHANVYLSTSPGGSNVVGRYWFDCYDAASNKLFEFKNSGGAGLHELRVFGDTTVAQTYATPHIGGALKAVDVKVDLSGGNIHVQVYDAGGTTPIYDVTAANTGGKGNPVKETWLAYQLATNGGTAYQTISECIVADEDTRGWGLAMQTPSGAGFHGDWQGGFAALGDGDEMTAASASSAGAKVSSTISAYGGPASPAGIRAIAVAARASKGATGPSDIEQFLRIGGANYGGGNIGPGEEIGYHLSVWDNNPATVAAWGTVELTFEVGAEAKV